MDDYRAIGIFEGCMSCEDRVVWFNDTGGDLGRWINSELEFGFFGVVDGQTFKKKCTKSRSSATTKRMEDKDTLETIAYTQLDPMTRQKGVYKHQQDDLSSP